MYFFSLPLEQVSFKTLCYQTLFSPPKKILGLSRIPKIKRHQVIYDAQADVLQLLRFSYSVLETLSPGYK